MAGWMHQINSWALICHSYWVEYLVYWHCKVHVMELNHAPCAFLCVTDFNFRINPETLMINTFCGIIASSWNLHVLWQVHKGFYAAYHNTSLHDYIVAAVQTVQRERNDLRILVTGHSMGGAMAAFCALDLTVNLFLLCL
jgi:hypothetical protein